MRKTISEGLRLSTFFSQNPAFKMAVPAVTGQTTKQTMLLVKQEITNVERWVITGIGGVFVSI